MENSEFKCKCQEQYKKINVTKKCCCETYRKNLDNGTAKSKDLWQRILNNTSISKKCDEIKTDFKCSCSEFTFCQCCQLSKHQNSLNSLEKCFHDLFKENGLFSRSNLTTQTFLITSIVEGFEEKDQEIKQINLNNEENIKNKENQFKQALDKKGQQMELLQEAHQATESQLKNTKSVIKQNEKDKINLENALEEQKNAHLKNAKSLNEQNQKDKIDLENALKEQKDAIERVINKDKVQDENCGYDLVIHIDSLRDLMGAGWKLSYSEYNKLAKQKIKDSLNSSKISIGLIGYENVGKTHFLNKLCGDNLPLGFNYHTQGLSFKISENENFPFIYADAAGCGKPFPYFMNSISEKDQKDQNIEEKTDIVNDRIMTETFIQDFILATCNIILIMLGQLTQENQKMIERIIRNYHNKKIFIIHNFLNLAHIESVEEKIKRDIIEAFPVKEQPLIVYEAKKDQIKRNNKQYIEERKGNCISHMVYAREETEAGNYYNENTIESIKMFLRTDLNFKKFNLVESFNEFCSKEKLKTYLSLENKEVKDLKISEIDNHLQLNKKISFKIKQGVFNAFGTLIIDNVQENEYEPAYKVYESDIKFTIFISIPGRVRESDDKVVLKSVKEDQTKGIQIEGICGNIFKKVKEDEFMRKEGVITGNFNKRILFCDQEKDFAFDKKTIEYFEGVYIVTLPKQSIESKEVDI